MGRILAFGACAGGLGIMCMRVCVSVYGGGICGLKFLGWAFCG